ncbi:hypothetical protein EZV73_01815 [Acidaminobacter sp. JC074]|uniref:hypothetical protein n=1 Tax=Acidaminobacter sp. JC074 TaxID=2530199 RepID=UPI001F0E85B8|nr:hypothetical protein [Acidaminobacter sp. JC074]MCH4886282.1 hypothetical protein [Acidaminobacter sp. JC074]
MKKRIVFAVTIICIIIFLMPMKASWVISHNFDKSKLAVRDFIVVYPGVDQKVTSYELTPKGIEILFDELKDMTLVKFPIGNFMTGNSSERTYKIDLVENEEKLIYINTFKNQMSINDKYYLIVNRGDLLFDNLSDELIVIQEF